MTGINVERSSDASSGVETFPTQAGMNGPQTRDAVLVVDVDGAAARALLFDMVEGSPRFVAVGVSRSTAVPPLDDPAPGIVRAIRDLEEQTGRALIDGEQLITPQRPNGDGIDACFVTGMPVPPLRAALITVGQSDLRRELASAARRTTTILADSTEDLPEGDGTVSSTALREWLALARPETVVLLCAGGTPDDWTVVLDAVADLARDGVVRSGIVVSDDAHQQQAAAALGSILDLSGTDPSTVDAREIASALESELRAAYARRVSEASSGRLLAAARFVDRPHAVQLVTAFLNRRMGRNVLAISMSEGTVLQAALEGRGAAVHRAERDLGSGVRSLLAIPPEDVLRWLPARTSTEDVTQWILNRALRPFTVMESQADRLMAAALQRELLARLVREAGLPEQPDVDLIAAGPASPGESLMLTVLTLLDGIQPTPAAGVVSVAADLEGMMVSAGAIAGSDPAYARDVLEQDFLTPLATCIVITGSAPEGALAVRGELRREGGESTRFSVPAGSLHRLPLPEGETATLILEPEPGFAVGKREPGEVVRLEGEQQVFGAELGVIIDARGRPISLPDDREARVARLQSWLADLGVPAE